MPYVSKNRWFVTEDRSEVVPDGDARAAFLLVGRGGEIDNALARKYDLEEKDRKVKEEADSQSEESGPASEDRARSGPNTRARRGPRE